MRHRNSHSAMLFWEGVLGKEAAREGESLRKGIL